MHKFEGVANTLFVPLVARINVSKRFPEYFFDPKALELETFLPPNADQGSSEYSHLASAARSYNMDKMVTGFAGKHKSCNLVYLGAGLDTAYDRLNGKLTSVQWHQVDLPEVIKAREMVFGLRAREILIPGDMFRMGWTKTIDSSLPTLLVAAGIFQYFHEEEVVAFIKDCKRLFPKGEMIFDATSKSGLRFTNWFIKRTGNADAVMYFGIDDGKSFAGQCGVKLLEERTFFPDALAMLGKRLGLITRLSMKVADKKKQVLVLHLAFY